MKKTSPPGSTLHLLLGAVTSMALSTAHAGGPGAHVHGKAELEVAVDGAHLEIRLAAPLDSLVGFEHAPRNDKQRATAKAAVERLRKPEALFVPTPAASCTPAKLTLESAALSSELLGEPAPAATAGRHGSEHADLDGTFLFRCAAPDRLQGLEVNLLQAFPRMRQRKVQVAGPRGQAATVLVPGRTSVRW